MAKVSAYFCFLLQLAVCLVHVNLDVIYIYEFERAVGRPGVSRSPWRSNASGLAALHLFNGDVLEIDLCLTQGTELFIAELQYSNDGESDVIKFEMDGGVVAEVQTELTTNGWGHHWNKNKRIGPVSKRFAMPMGTHTLRIMADTTDCYGTEIDQLMLAVTNNITSDDDLFCGVRLFLSETPTPCAIALDESFPDQSTTAKTTTTSTISSSTSSSSPSSSTPSSTSSSSTATPSSTTTTVTTTTKASTPKPKTPVILQQLSYDSECLDHPNVLVKFHAEKLKGTKIIARTTPNVKSNMNIMEISRSNEVKGKFCEKIVWQIGEINHDHSELGSNWNQEHIDFDVNSHVQNQRPFPGEIDSALTHEIILRYVVPKHISLKNGQLRFTLGLLNVSEGLQVGLQYFRRHRRNPSDIKNITFSSRQQVMGWILPVRAISPSLENQLILHFDENSAQKVKIDFIRLEYIAPTPRTKPVILSLAGKWKIRGRQFLKSRRGPRGKLKFDGMKVMVNGNVMRGQFEKIYIIRKPNNEMLTVYDNGEIFPTHESRLTEKRTKDSYYRLQDVTGIRFGPNDIQLVDVDTFTKTLTIKYNDSSTVGLSFKYSKLKSVFIVKKANVKQKTMTFFSTYISAVTSAISELKIDDDMPVHILNSTVNGRTGNIFKFENKANNPLFDDVNDEYEIRFP
ncbi:hypothetical protein ACF0H5_000639 [Mactra antiquata]